MSAGSVGCAAGQMTEVRQRSVTPHLTWSVTCPGDVRYHCSSQYRAVRCEIDVATLAGVGSEAAAPQAVSSGAVVTPEALAAVTRTRGADGYALDTVLEAAGAQISLHAVPAVDARRVWLGVRVPRTGEPACRSRVLVDGAMTDMPPESRVATADGEEVRSIVSVDLLHAIANGGRVVGQTCGHEWVIAPSLGPQIRAFLVRVGEDASLAAP